MTTTVATGTAPQKPTELYAILGLIFAFVFPILGLIFSIMAKNRLKQNPNLEGKGLADAGFVLSIIFICLAVVWIILWVLFMGLTFMGTFGMMNATSTIK